MYFQEFGEAEGPSSIEWETWEDIQSSAGNWMGHPWEYNGKAALIWTAETGWYQQGIDCSNWVHQVYGQAGLIYDYRNSGTFDTVPQFRKLVQGDTIQVGDVILWASHMGIYMGNGIVANSRLGNGEEVQYNTFAVIDQAAGGSPSFYRWDADSDGGEPEEG